MATTKIQTSGVTAQSITHDKLHTDMNLSTKTVVLPTMSSDITLSSTPYPRLHITDTVGVDRQFSVGVDDERFKIRNETGSFNAFVIDNVNRVALGHDLPTSVLDVKGEIELRDKTGNLAHGMSVFSDTNVYAIIAQESSGDGGLRITSLSDATTAASAFQINAVATTPSTDGNNAAIRLRAAKKNGTSEQALAATEDVLSIGNVGTEIVVVKGSGNVGIGEASPTSKLELYASNRNFDDTENAIRITYPAGPVLGDVGGGIVFAQRWYDQSTQNVRTGGIYGIKTHGNGAYGGGLAFYTQPANANDMRQTMVLTDDKYVGIGTSSPAQNFVVAEATNGKGIEVAPGTLGYIQAYDRGTNAYSDLKIDALNIAFGTNNGSTIMHLDSDGNVGIGTDNPIETLDVDGSIQSRIGARNYLVSKRLMNAVGSGSATKYILIRKTTTAGGSKFIGRISGTRTEGVSANNHALLDIGYDVNSNNQYPKFYLDYLSGYSATNYGHITARFVSLDWDDGNGSATWHAIEISSSSSSNWPADLDYMSFQGYQINVDDLQVISDDTGSYNAISNITSMGRGGTKSIMHTNVGIGTNNPVAKLHVWNEQGGNATDKATMLSEAVMKIQPHATNSTNMLISQVDGGNSMGIQVTNGPATANWDLSLSPFGGHVGIGVVDPTRRLSVVGPSGTDVVQSIRNPNTSWSQYALTRYGTEGEDVRYMDFGYYRGSTEANRGLVIKSQANANIVYFLDSGKVGIKTEPIGSFNVNGTSTIYNAHQDPDLTVTPGSGHSMAGSGEISMVATFQGTGANNDLFEFQYDATSWKSFGFEIDISTAVGWGKVTGGGYNNGGVSGSYSISGSKITAFAFDNVSGNSQAHILRCTFGGGVHHTIRVKYWQGGGDGGPRADRATMRFIS